MKKNRFISGYSGLRALAVIGVILYHLDPNRFIGGYLGVPIFFVLAGYLVTDHIFRSYLTTGYYDNKKFYLGRLKRLYPQLLSVLWLSSTWILLFQRNLLAKLNQIVFANIFNYYNFWQIFNGQSYFERFAANESPFTHLWTMSIEAQFYILWPLVVFLLFKFVKARKRIFWTLIGFSLASAIEMAILYHLGADINRLYYGSDTRFFALGLGAALAIVWPIEDLREKVETSTTVILDTTGLIAFLGMIWLTFSKTMNAETAFPYQGGMFLFTLFTTIFVGMIAHPASHWNQILTNKLFDWIGSRSYGIYLYQFPVMIFFEDKFQDIADHVILYRIIEIVIILVLSEISYRVIEKPFAKINRDKIKLYFNQVIFNPSKKLAAKVPFILGIIVFVLGTVAIIVSPQVKGENFNQSQLAQRIKKNKAAQEKDNKKLIDEYKKEHAKKKTKPQVAESAIVKKAKEDAKKHPVNKSFEKYGISQVDLQLAQSLSLTAIGDSVMAGSSNDLKLLMPKAIIDAAVSRQVSAAFPLISSYASQGALGDNVLIGLGTNGPFPMSDLDQVMRLVGKDRHVFWINTHVPSRPWQGPVNRLLNQAAQKYHNLTIIDWYGYSKAHKSWFYQDETHPNINGSKYYSAFIVKTIIKNMKF